MGNPIETLSERHRLTPKQPDKRSFGNDITRPMQSKHVLLLVPHVSEATRQRDVNV